MADWTLTHTRTGTTRALGGDITASPGGWGFHIADHELNSLSADVVVLEMVPDDFSDVTEPRGDDWVYGDNVVILRDGVRWFEGELGDSTRSASDSEHIISWQINGPWQVLEELNYYQSYATTREDGADPPAAVKHEVKHGDVTLMQSYDFATDTVTILRTGEQIEALLDFGTTETTAPLYQVGNVDAGIFVDFVEARDETVANLVRKLARWHPLASAWFDYSTSPPTLHFEEMDGGASAFDVDMDDFADGTGVDITENASLVVPYVAINYKTISQVNVDGESSSFTDISQDVYPVGSDTSATDHRRALRATVDLAGANASIQVQRVRTRTLPLSSDGSNVDPGAPALPAPDTPPNGTSWQEEVRKFCAQEGRLPWLRDLAPTGDITSNIGVVSFEVSKSGTDGVNAFPSGEEDPVYDLWDTPRVLDRGSTTADWMDVKTQPVTVRVKLIFQGAARSGRNVRQHFTGVDEATGRPMVEAEFNLIATDAISKSYERTTSVTAAETPPTGIAQKLYDDLSILKYTGSIRLNADEFPVLGLSSARPGMVLNIDNSQNTAWETMRVQIQRVKRSFKNRTTVINIGSPDQLGLNDFVTLARLWKANPPSFTTEDERKTGKKTGRKGGGKSVGGEASPNEGSVIINHTPRDPFVVSVVAEASPATGFKLYVEPVWITTDRAPNDPAPVAPVMPTIGATSLDDDTRPTLSMATGLTRVVYAEHNYDADGVLTGTEVKIAASLPDDDGAIDDPEHREIATIKTDQTPPLVIQKVEGGYHQPSKQETAVVEQEFHMLDIEEIVGKPNCYKLVRNRFTGTFIKVVPIVDVPPILGEWNISKCFDATDSEQYQEIDLTETEFETAGDPDCEIVALTPKTLKVPKNFVVTDGAVDRSAFKLCDEQPGDYPDWLEVTYGGSESTTEETAAAYAVGFYERVIPNPAGVITYRHEDKPSYARITADGTHSPTAEWALFTSQEEGANVITDRTFYNTVPTTEPEGGYKHYNGTTFDATPLVTVADNGAPP